MSELHNLPWQDESTADPVEKARRVLRHLLNQSDAYFYNDGFPRSGQIATGITNVLAVLEALAAPVAAQEPVGRVAVCPTLDRECGEYYGGWCATCPKARTKAPGARQLDVAAMLEGYAASYDTMGRVGSGSVDCASVAMDIRQNMIPVAKRAAMK